MKPIDSRMEKKMEETKQKEESKNKLPKSICDIGAQLVTYIDQMDQQRKTNDSEKEAKDNLYYDDNKSRRKKKI